MDDKAVLLQEIADEARACADWTGRPRLSARVAAAMAAVPRERFVPPGETTLAYINAPLPIGHGQTISQPFIVAIMTELLDLTPDSAVLEIGTGSGYQAAVLAEIARNVYSIEVIPELAAQARENLQRCGYDRVNLRVGDGHAGWPEHAPYDAIIVTAAAAVIPSALVDQLKPGGRMVIPIGLPGAGQMLTVVEKSAAGEIRTKGVLPVAFVPMVHAPAPGSRPTIH